jgi:hypothetical protein
MKNVRPLFDPATLYRIEIEGRVALDWLQSYDDTAQIFVDESRMMENTTVLSIHTDQSGIIGLVRRLHGLGMTILQFQIITRKE